jgi:hypothetical protein
MDMKAEVKTCGRRVGEVGIISLSAYDRLGSAVSFVYTRPYEVFIPQEDCVGLA